MYAVPPGSLTQILFMQKNKVFMTDEFCTGIAVFYAIA